MVLGHKNNLIISIPHEYFLVLSKIEKLHRHCLKNIKEKMNSTTGPSPPQIPLQHSHFRYIIAVLSCFQNPKPIELLQQFLQNDSYEFYFKLNITDKETC